VVPEALDLHKAYDDAGDDYDDLALVLATITDRRLSLQAREDGLSSGRQLTRESSETQSSAPTPLL